MRLILFLALIGGVGVAMAADDETLFQGILKKFGMPELVADAKRPCLCVGGSLSNRLGLAIAPETPSGDLKLSCLVPQFAGRSLTGYNECVANGGAVTLISK
jgi:hypothetical protein